MRRAGWEGVGVDSKQARCEAGPQPRSFVANKLPAAVEREQRRFRSAQPNYAAQSRKPAQYPGLAFLTGPHLGLAQQVVVARDAVNEPAGHLWRRAMRPAASGAQQGKILAPG